MKIFELNRFQRKRKCLKVAQFYVDVYPISERQLLNILQRRNYTRFEILYALKRLEVDWQELCFLKMCSLPAADKKSLEDTRKALRKAGFLDEEIDKALCNF